LGTPRGRGEGLRIGTVRRPPRGVRKADYSKQNWYDVWLPSLAPSDALVRRAQLATDAGEWKQFERRFTAELKRPEAAHLLDTLAALSHHASFSVGCYCADESRCHRSILRRALAERGARIR
jgi:uncharacterized protein YeaO (DUF488 family)